LASRIVASRRAAVVSCGAVARFAGIDDVIPAEGAVLFGDTIGVTKRRITGAGRVIGVEGDAKGGAA